MTEVVAPGPVLADSTFRTRPHFQTYLLTDANAGGNAVRQIESHRRRRHMKFPSLAGRHDFDSFQKDLKDNSYKQCNDEGDHRAPAPYRDYTNIVDPVSGFVSAGGEVDRNTGHGRIKNMVQLTNTPQAKAPQDKHSDRKNDDNAPPPLRRSNTYEPGAPSAWNSRKISDYWIRGKLGGWTSDYDPRKPPPDADLRRTKSAYATISKPPSEQEGKNNLATRYMYSASTQRGYEEVPWDGVLAPKQWSPVSTLEEKADLVSYRLNSKRYDLAAKEWQNVGRGWDWFQTRQGYNKGGHIEFCSPGPRAEQIPLYGGVIGAENWEEIDNPNEAFKPFVVKRVKIPRTSETSHRPNIPGYSGCTLWRGAYAPAHSIGGVPNSSTTAAAYRPMPVPESPSEHKKDGPMSKMVTLVPPCNPFNKINKMGEVLQTTIE